MEQFDANDILKKLTRKDIHRLFFGIDPPELDSPYCSCARNNGCEKCKHKNDKNCDVNWWNAPYIDKKDGE